MVKFDLRLLVLLVVVILVGAVILGLSISGTLFPTTEKWPVVGEKTTVFQMGTSWKIPCSSLGEITLVVKEISPIKKTVFFLDASANRPKEQSPLTFAVEGTEIIVRGVAVGMLINVNDATQETDGPTAQIYPYKACRY